MATIVRLRDENAAREIAETALRAVRRKPSITVEELAGRLTRRFVEIRDETADVAQNARALARAGMASESAFWGEEPSASALAAARRRGATAVEDARAQVLADSLSREEAAELLGVTAQAISARRKAGKLVALKRGREYRFPAWQFGEDGPLAGLAEVISAWPGTILALSLWAAAPSVDLRGHTPARELERGHVARVLELVEAGSPAAW